MQAQQAQFDEATSLLSDAQYREALAMYKTIAGQGHNSGALWQNMGIAYSRLDSLGAAKFYFLKAKNFPETREQAEQSLLYVEERFTRRSAVLPKLPWDRFLDMLSDNIGLRNLYLAGFLFLNAAAGFLIGGWFHRQREKIFIYISAASLILAAVIFTCAIWLNYTQNRFSTGVVTDRQVTVFENPNEGSAPVGNAFEGYEVQVDFVSSGQYDGWKYIRLQNGMYGWLPSESILYM